VSGSLGEQGGSGFWRRPAVRWLLTLVVFVVAGERAAKKWLGEEAFKGLWYWRLGILLVGTFVILMWLAFVGNGGGGSPLAPGPGENGLAGPPGHQQETLFHFAVENLNRLDEFDSGGMLAQVIGRLNRQAQGQKPSPDRDLDALMATCPEPEMLRQIVNRLDQWVRSQPPLPDWKPDPLVETLPAPLRELPAVRDLGKLAFSGYDGFHLREAVWFRDVSNWARGDELDEVECARKLFDWTIRNVQLDPDAPDQIPLMPWETLLFGRGTAMERAEVFILLARQQGIDAVLLALPEDPGETDPSAALRPWAVAILSQGELYLFDTALGLPIPAPDGVKLTEAGPLDVRPATLTQVAEKDALLRRLDVEEADYPVQSSDLKREVELLSASPEALSARMTLVESRLARQQKMVLTAAPSLQVERLKQSGQVSEVRLWTRPFETIRQRSLLPPERIQGRLVAILPFYMVSLEEDEAVEQIPQFVGPAGPDQTTAYLPLRSVTETQRSVGPLRKGRLLYLKGKFVGPQGAAQFLQQARPANRRLDEVQKQTAAGLYQLYREANPNADEQQIRRLAADEAGMRKALFIRAKEHANYWLGLLALQQDDYASAVDYFLKHTLLASPGGPWVPGARYNLARTFEDSGQYKKALEYYRAPPTYTGNLVRAQWLEALQPETTAEPSPGDVPEPPVKTPEPAAEVPEPKAEVPGQKARKSEPAPEVPEPTVEPPSTPDD